MAQEYLSIIDEMRALERREDCIDGELMLHDAEKAYEDFMQKMKQEGNRGVVEALSYLLTEPKTIIVPMLVQKPRDLAFAIACFKRVPGTKDITMKLEEAQAKIEIFGSAGAA